MTLALMLKLLASPIGRVLLWSLSGAVLLGGAYGWLKYREHKIYNAGYTAGYAKGELNVQVEWNKAVERAVVEGEKAGADAVRDVERAGPDGMRDDPWNRDNLKAGPGKP
jgi:hypothetical protein